MNMEININDITGVIYDAIFYCVAYFNRRTLFTRSSNYNITEQEKLYHYNNIRSTTHVPNPPDCLFALFYYDGIRCCAMTAYLEANFNFFYNSIDSFYSKFLDKRQLKSFIMTYYFGNHFNEKELQKLCLSEGETVLRAAAILSEKVEIKYYTYMFFHFNELIDKALEFFQQLIPFIKAYHSNHKKEELNNLQKFMSLDNQRLVRKSLLKCNEQETIKLENQMYSMCYLNQFIIARYPKDNNFIFILGCDWNITISQALDYSHVTMQSVMNALGHPVKIEIINELSKKDLTISQLARILQLARTSITRYIEDLLDELVIVKARKNGAEIYYHLNSTYLRYAKATFDSFLEQKIIDTDKLL